MEIGRKLTPSQILLRFFINIFCDQNFKVLFSTPCSLFEEENKNGDDDDEEEDDKHKQQGTSTWSPMQPFFTLLCTTPP